MNILITGDDGPEAYGLTLLRNTAALVWRGAKIVTITPEKPMTGQGMAITPRHEIALRQIEKDFYTARARPADIIYAAFEEDKLLTSGATWDLVMAGVNHGHNVGLDLYHSGTVGQAMLAATAFGSAGWALSQEMDETSPTTPEEDRAHFKTAERFLPDFLRQQSPMPGECFNVNFPKIEAQGYRTTQVSHWSRWKNTPPSSVPRARAEQSDITNLAKGFITISEIALRVNPPLPL